MARKLASSHAGNGEVSVGLPGLKGMMELNGVYGKASLTVGRRTPPAPGAGAGPPLLCALWPLGMCCPFMLQTVLSVLCATSLIMRCNETDYAACIAIRRIRARDRGLNGSRPWFGSCVLAAVLS